MLNLKELQSAKVLYDMIEIYGQFSSRDVNELDELLCRASNEQVREVTYADDPESRKRVEEAAARNEWAGRGPVYMVPVEALRPIEELQNSRMEGNLLSEPSAAPEDDDDLPWA